MLALVNFSSIYFARYNGLDGVSKHPTCPITFRQRVTQLVFFAVMYYGGLKVVPLGFKRLVILQAVDKVKLNLSSCFSIATLTLVKRDDNFDFTL